VESADSLALSISLKCCGPTGFALERLRDAKRVYEKAESGQARNAKQESRNAARRR